MSKNYEELYDYIKGLEIIDTHEHLPAFEKSRDPNADVLAEYLSHYFCRDLVSAGLPESEMPKLASCGIDITEKWRIVEPYWKMCRNTGYGQSLDFAARGIYGIERIDGDTIQALNEKFREGLSQQHFRKVLKELCRIKVSVLDIVPGYEETGFVPDGEYFIKTNRIDRLVLPKTHEDIMFLEERYGNKIRTFEDYLDACNAAMEFFASRSRILKCALAYERSLFFERTPWHEAETEFLSLFPSSYHDRIVEPCVRPVNAGIKFQNYLMHHILSIAEEKEMVLQIHTGIQEGNGSYLEYSNPALLNNLFLDYPGLKFDVFHISYPYQGKLGVMAKWLPNVWADMCWSHIVSPAAARNTLNEWLEMVPYNKILGFGGDYLFVDGVYGHLTIAQKNIALTLAGRVDSGLFEMDEAKLIAHALLCQNPAQVYGIE